MLHMGVKGINHLTLSVADLQRSIAFYRDDLGFQVRAVWLAGAHLEAGSLWLSLALEPGRLPTQSRDYTHIAFDIDAADLNLLLVRLGSRARCWKANSSEGASLYLLDPDDHKLEFHVGSLASRLVHYAQHPPKGWDVLP